MSSNKKLQGASGFLNLSGPLNVEDVFSTYVYTGTSGSLTVNNGIDLSGEGGLVWFKDRNYANNHRLYDTARGVRKYLDSSATDAEATNSGSGNSNGISAFNNNGFDIGNDGFINDSSSEYVSWSFRKAENFFDVVTYTGDGVNGRNVTHNLGVAPGMIIYKPLSAVGGDGSADVWWVDHRSLNAYKSLRLNSNVGEQSYYVYWSDRFHADHLNLNGNVNHNGINYVAYVFGHDTSDEGLIQCGSYTGNGSTSSGPHIDLGFEPQWLLVKSTAASTNWTISDMVRGFHHGNQINLIYPHLTNAEASISTTPSQAAPTSTGFQIQASGTNFNTNGTTYIYMAIRRGPMATPTSRSSVFAVTNETSATLNDSPKFKQVSNFPVDFVINKMVGAASSWWSASRITNARLQLEDSAAETSVGSTHEFDHNDGVAVAELYGASNFMGYMFRRAPNFFDVVTYVGTGSAKTENHGLGVVPEMMWVKNRSDSEDWAVYYGDATDYLKLNTTAATADDNTFWNDTAPTSTVFTIGSDDDVNKNNSNYIAYLFATLAGISKVGSFSHTNGSSTDVDCGFSSGSSFVIVKRYDSTGDWYVWDSARGIVSGNDDYMLFNSTAAEVTSTDYIDPLNSGFQIASGFTTGTYFFYAIAA